MSIYRLKPAFREKIWGGHKFRDIYHMHVGDGLIGEGWIASSIPGKEDNFVEGMGATLSELYAKKRELFGTWSTEIIPIKVMLADCNQNTSVQLHPADRYALEHDHSLGKPECAFFLEADEGAIGIYGHNAKNMDELKKMVAANQWDELLRKYNIHKNDFAYVPAGRVHATCKGTVILEISRNADLTYRVYDFDRVGADGKPRKLDLKKTFDVIRCPDSDHPIIKPEIKKIDGGILYTYVDVPGEFSVYRIEIDKHGEFGLKEFGFWFIQEGEGMIADTRVKKGEIYFVPCKQGELKIDGRLSIIIASYKEPKDEE